MNTGCLDLGTRYGCHGSGTRKEIAGDQKRKDSRLCKKACAQDGCLTETEQAVMLKISQPTVGVYLREYEEEYKTILPRRETIHDMGPT